MKHRSLTKRILLAGMGFLTALTLFASPLATHTVHAQGAVVVTDDLGRRVNQVLEEIFQALSQAAVVAFFNAARTFAGQIAYDAANYLASGGTGQGALAFKDGFGAYLENVGEDAAGEFIGSLSDDFFENAGFDLCRPPNPRNLLNLQLSLSTNIPGIGNLCPEGADCVSRPRPRCDFQEIVQNYENVYTTLSNAEITDFVSASFSPNASELGASASILGRFNIDIDKEIRKATLEREEGDGYKPVEGKVKEDVKTPAKTVQKEVEAQLVDKPKTDESNAFLATMSTAFEQGFVQLASYTASMFLNTLTNKLVQRIMEKGILGAFDFGGPAAVTFIGPDSISVRGKTDARKANIDLKNVSLVRVSNIEMTGELIACPENRGLWNCAADENLAQLIQGKTDEGSKTIRKAIADGNLKADWELIPTSDVIRNQSRNCFKEAYCAGNLQKLRALRILPVGLEFAANSQENINRCAGSSRCATLGEVVESFANCNEEGKRDADHPWCNLVDPNWIITSFEQQCNLSGYGDALISSRLSSRREECQDIRTCLQRNDEGECIGGFGQCLAEKTVYRFGANECPAQFASCRSYVSRSGQGASFLRYTIDSGVCNAQNVGCLGYATVRNLDRDWVT